MNEESQIEELLVFFKALSDATRLKIIGLLATQSLTVEQLAAMLEVWPSTVSHHLKRLAEVGLVSARAEGYYNMYQLEMKALENMAQRLLSQESLPAVAANVDVEAYDRKVWANYVGPDGRLKTIPAQQKKRLSILNSLALMFEPGIRYSEKQVNEMLKRYHDDTATLRRELVDHRMLARENGEYWLVEQ